MRRAYDAKAGTDLASTFRIRGHILEECSQLCPCQCHSITALRSPEWMSGVVGTLFFHYTSRPTHNRRQCDSELCSASDSHASFEYVFPTWLIPLAILLRGGWSQMGGLSGSWRLRVPVHCPPTAIALSAMLHNSQKDCAQLGRYMHRHKIQPHARRRGISIFEVRDGTFSF